MHVMVIGAAGMIGRKLVERLAAEPGSLGREIASLTLADVVEPPLPPAFSSLATTLAIDLSTEGSAERLISSRPDVIIHLAAIVSGEAEADFDKGYLVNLDGTRALFEAIRREGQRERYLPRVLFASSIAVFGQPFPEKIGDEFFTTPLTSYGTQKAICELLLADYTRRGFFDGIGIRLPTICIRPGKPNKAASGFFPTSCASRSSARKLSCRWTRKSGIGSRARARPWASSSMRREWTRVSSGRGATSPCRGSRRWSARRSRRSPALPARRP